MKLSSPHNQTGRQLAILISGFGLGLMIGAIWDQTTEVKAVAGLALAVLAVSIMVMSEIGLL